VRQQRTSQTVFAENPECCVGGLLGVATTLGLAATKVAQAAAVAMELKDLGCLMTLGITTCTIRSGLKEKNSINLLHAFFLPC
jgi:hypothetical protein